MQARLADSLDSLACRRPDRLPAVLGHLWLVRRSLAWRPEVAVLEAGLRVHLEGGLLARQLDLAR